MQSRKNLAHIALKQALSARLLLKISIENTFCVYDYAEEAGIEVKFVDIPSMEGMYLSQPKNTILVTSHKAAMRVDAGLSARQRMANDIMNIRRNFGRKSGFLQLIGRRITSN